VVQRIAAIAFALPDLAVTFTNKAAKEMATRIRAVPRRYRGAILARHLPRPRARQLRDEPEIAGLRPVSISSMPTTAAAFSSEP